MTPRRCFFLFAVLLLALVTALPAFGVSKEIIQLQTQVQQLQDQMARMQQSFDERMGVMKNLVEQTSDNINKMTTSVDNLSKQVEQLHNDAGSRSDQVQGQVQALHDSVDELKAKLTAISKQLDDLKNSQQNIGGATQPPGAAASQAPPPDVLYNNALRDYTAGRYTLAQQEFGDYLKYYLTTDLAGNAQFYLAEIDYKQGDLEGAVKAYNTVIEQFVGNNKVPAAQLKKGFALIDLGQQSAGVKELQSLVARFPRSPEATQARDRLRKLGASAAGSRRPAR